MSDDYDDETIEELDPATILWSGRQWMVTTFGLETRESPISMEIPGYQIPAYRLGSKLLDGEGETTYPVEVFHMAGKNWLDIEDFLEAYARALKAHDGQYPTLAPAAFAEAAEMARHRVALRVVHRLTDKFEGRKDAHLRYVTDYQSIETDHAQIEWSELGQLVDEVEVFHRDAYARGRREPDGRLENSAGACASDWLAGQRRATPTGVYAQWLLKGFSSPERHVDALRELGKIDGMDWAVQLAAAMTEEILAGSADTGEHGES